MSDTDPALTYLRNELLQFGVMLNEAKCAPWLLGLRLSNIAELFSRMTRRIDTDSDFSTPPGIDPIPAIRSEREGAADEALLDRYADRPDGGGLLVKALGCSL
jgi:hypothetical protein